MKNRIRNLTSTKDLIGIGTGTTIEKFIKYLNKDKTYVASSYQTLLSLHKYNLKTIQLPLIDTLDLYIDGTDYFDNLGNLIKGKGGALTNEKLMCSMSKEIVILAQDYKFRESFEDCFVPIEIIPQSLNYVKSIIEKSNLTFSLRTGQGKHGPMITENGNLVINVKYDRNLLTNIKSICGVIEHGYFDGSDHNIVLEIFNKNTFLNK